MSNLRACTEGKARADVYRRAAELIADGSERYSCHAIEKAVGTYPKNCPERRAYERALGKNSCGRRPYMLVMDFEEMWLYESPHIAAYRHHRVVALCFMAAMVEAGDA